ncbi:MAG TPA: hypothetical protein PLB91_08635, partial [Spirochaetales bacterium]|nr:hypothetical protein [Spirochaetales bacterium]
MAELFETGIWDGERKLAIRILAGRLQSKSLSLSRLLQAKGLIVEKDTVREWSTETIQDENGDTLFIGPDFEGQSLDEVCSNDKKRGLCALLDVSRAFMTIDKLHKNIPCPPSSGILINGEDEDRGTVLILPPELAQRAFHSRDQGARSSSAVFLRSPRAEGFAAEAAFLLAQMVYRTASGQDAYSVEQESQDMAQGSFIPLRERCPELDAGLARTVDETLFKPRPADLARLVSALQVASTADWYRELSPEEKNDLSRQLAVSQMKLSNRKRREAFWRSKKSLVAGFSVCCALILVFALSLADARRGKP